MVGLVLQEQKEPMPRPQAAVALDMGEVLAESYAVNDRMNQIVIEHLDQRAWRAKPPGDCRARTIAAIFCHVHNVRRKWLRLSAPHLTLPPPLDRVACTQQEARAALAQSADRCCQMLVEALARPGGRVESFRRDGWARPWPAGPAMLAFMITHDAHHRGQVCMLAHQLGFPLPIQPAYGMSVWEKLWKQCDFTRPR